MASKDLIRYYLESLKLIITFAISKCAKFIFMSTLLVD